MATGYSHIPSTHNLMVPISSIGAGHFFPRVVLGERQKTSDCLDNGVLIGEWEDFFMECVLIVVYVYRYAPEHSLGGRLKCRFFKSIKLLLLHVWEEPAEVVWASGQDAFQMCGEVFCAFTARARPVMFSLRTWMRKLWRGWSGLNKLNHYSRNLVADKWRKN